MGKSGRTRSEKLCDSCAKQAFVLYRVKTDVNVAWAFMCKNCQLEAAKQASYQYGGTWKQNKRN